MKVVDQNIPAELYNQYVRTLGQAQAWIPGSDIRSLSKRDWYELIHRRSPPRGAPSKAQLKVRAAFLKCVDCFNASPKTGGVEPPAIGYRSREWWYAKSLDPPEQNWKRTEMVTWAGWDADPYQLKDTNYDYHNANWFLKTDEQDFIDFYDEMKPKYGYPWSAKNDPDQIVTKMNQIVCDEIDYDHEGDMSVCFTPGQTAQARKGVCDDQSALHYALTWKALKELGWSDSSINNRLACVVVDREDNRHMYNWWKSNAGGTKIVENTYNPGESPRVIGGMKYWGDDQPKYLIQRFDKGGHFEPVWTYPEIILPLWYYNYFIKYSWPVFYDDDIPPWCGAVVPCDSTTQGYWKHTGQHYDPTFDGAWNAAYNHYQGMSWAECEYCWDNLNCYGNAGRPYNYWALISCTKNTLVFKPKNHMTQSKWDKIETIKIMFRRSIPVYHKVGGGIRCIQTDETQDQVNDWSTFYIPKSNCNFEEFSLTFEGLCRDSGDLKPDVPPYGQSRTCGANDQISNAKLYCV